MTTWEETKKELAETEPLDPEVIRLCDALNAAGFVTEASCSGHGGQRLMVWFEHSTDARIEQMARFVISKLEQPYSVRIRKQIYGKPGEYNWSIEVNHWDIWAETPQDKALKMWEEGANEVARLISLWTVDEAAKKAYSKEYGCELALYMEKHG